jgi:PAS domain S-box-containing protein
VVLRGTLFNVIPIARTMIIESMDDAVIVLDGDSRVVDVNPAAASLLRQPAARMLGRPAGEVFVARQDIVEAFADAKEERAEITVGEGADPRVFDLQISTIYSRIGRELGRLIVLRDITRRKEAEMERERLIGDLNAYARTVAHDLKNPLGVITGYVDFINLKYQADLSEELQDRLGIIRRTGQKMIRIVDELLMLASIRRDDEVEVHPVDTQGAVEGALARLSQLIDESNGEIVLPDRWPGALGHEPWVEEIWANYISNALKYGGDPPRIELGADEVADDRVRFWVRDNGQGLTAEEQQKLFAEFARLDQHVAIQGHGLGLSIVARIAQRLGGEVGLESADGEGSTFWFTLPAAGEPVTAT